MKGGRHHLLLNWGYQEVQTAKKASEAVIADRVAALTAFLRRNGVRPRIIDICRPRMSGHTPDDQVDFIERTLVEGLGSFLRIRRVHLEDPIPDRQGKWPRPRPRGVPASKGDRGGQDGTVREKALRIHIRDLPRDRRPTLEETPTIHGSQLPPDRGRLLKGRSPLSHAADLFDQLAILPVTQDD
jgi:hypothetical protein